MTYKTKRSLAQLGKHARNMPKLQHPDEAPTPSKQRCSHGYPVRRLRKGTPCRIQGTRAVEVANAKVGDKTGRNLPKEHKCTLTFFPSARAAEALGHLGPHRPIFKAKRTRCPWSSKRAPTPPIAMRAQWVSIAARGMILASGSLPGRRLRRLERLQPSDAHGFSSSDFWRKIVSSVISAKSRPNLWTSGGQA